MVASATDSDADGIPDWWETAHFGGATNAVSDEDTDGDGYLNRDEFVTLTDPKNPDSRFSVKDMGAVPPYQIHYLSATGRLYTLEGSSGPPHDPLSWQDLGTNQLGSGAPQQFTDVTPDPIRAYRIRVSIP
jgi:hypothetical protein